MPGVGYNLDVEEGVPDGPLDICKYCVCPRVTQGEWVLHALCLLQAEGCQRTQQAWLGVFVGPDPALLFCGGRAWCPGECWWAPVLPLLPMPSPSTNTACCWGLRCGDQGRASPCRSLFSLLGGVHPEVELLEWVVILYLIFCVPPCFLQQLHHFAFIFPVYD